MSTVFVTEGAGFIKSALVRRLIATTAHQVVNLDKLTYAADLEAVASISTDPRYHFEQVDICDADASPPFPAREERAGWRRSHSRSQLRARSVIGPLEDGD